MEMKKFTAYDHGYPPSCADFEVPPIPGKQAQPTIKNQKEKALTPEDYPASCYDGNTAAAFYHTGAKNEDD